MSHAVSQTPFIPFDSFENAEFLPLNPTLINDRLNQLWEASQEGDSARRKYLRVSLTDLVVICDTKSQPRAETLMLSFGARRPSRIIDIVIDEELSDTAPPRAQISISCSLSPEGAGLVCGERITVYIARVQTAVIPSIARSLSSGNNHVVIVDIAPMALSETVHAQLYSLANFCFFDSRCNRKKLAANIDAQRGEFSRLFDLEFERDYPLREAIKMAFDHERTRGALPYLKNVTLSCPALGASAVSRVAYLAGWVASKLNLTLVRRDGKRSATYRAYGRDILFQVTRGDDHSSNTNGSCAELSFEFAGTGGHTLTLRPSGEVSRHGMVFAYDLLWDGEIVGHSATEKMDDADYILRRLSDPVIMRNYTESLRQVIALARSGSQTTLSATRPEMCIVVGREDIATHGADIFSSAMREAVRRHGRFTVALSGGSTPIDLYRHLAASIHSSGREWRETYFFFGDERAVGPTHPDSNYRAAHEFLFAPLGIDERRVFRMSGERDNLSAAAHDYETTIARYVLERDERFGLPRFDLILLGLGADGHTASIFPDYPMESGSTSASVSAGKNISSIATATGVRAVYVGAKKKHRLTFTPELISAAENVLFLVSGEDKSDALYSTIIERDTPASRIFPERGRLTFLVDTKAAGCFSPSTLAALPWRVEHR